MIKLLLIYDTLKIFFRLKKKKYKKKKFKDIKDRIFNAVYHNIFTNILGKSHFVRKTVSCSFTRTNFLKASNQNVSFHSFILIIDCVK